MRLCLAMVLLLDNRYVRAGRRTGHPTGNLVLGGHVRLLDQDCQDDPDLCRHVDDPPERTTPPSAPPSTEAPAVAQQGESNSPCVADSTGFYGQTTGTEVALEYYYEIEYDTTIISIIDTDTLGLVEKTIDDAVVQRLFDQQCSDTRQAPQPPKLRRRLNTVGLQSLPKDMVAGGCLSTSGSLDGCVLILGRGSIFVDEEENAESTGQKTLEFVREVLQSSAFDDIQEGVSDVSFVNGTFTLTDAKEAEKDVGAEDSTDGDGLPAYGIALIVLGAFALVLAIALVLLARRRPPHECEPPEGMLQLDSIASVESDVSSHGGDMRVY